jgi:hypothetical protein
MMCSIGRQEHTFQVRHFKACPVAVEDGATAKGGSHFLINPSFYPLEMQEFTT